MSKTHCKWLKDDNMMLISPTGEVIPCCYLSSYFRAENIPAKNPDEWKIDLINDQLYHQDKVNYQVHQEYLFKEYLKRKSKLNIFTNDLEDILNDEWFTKILPESWESEDTISLPCKYICTDDNTV